jgi:hypothetical protein
MSRQKGAGPGTSGRDASSRASSVDNSMSTDDEGMSLDVDDDDEQLEMEDAEDQMDVEQQAASTEEIINLNLPLSFKDPAYKPPKKPRGTKNVVTAEKAVPAPVNAVRC